MNIIALIFSIISFIISILAWKNIKKENIKTNIIIKKKKGAILIKAKTPTQIRIDKRLKKSKNNKDIKLDELC